jgi:dihydroorotase
MSETKNEVTIPALFDAHVHLRNGPLMGVVAPYTDRCCGAALLMPNTEPPLDDPLMVEAYQMAVGPYLTRCRPYCTFKLTPGLADRLDDIDSFKSLGCLAGKLYPDGVTTNSHGGIPRKDLLGLKGGCLWPILNRMADVGLVLSIHAEMPGAFCLDREEAMLRVVGWMMTDIPKLRVVLEHITTAAACRFVVAGGPDNYGGRLAATITAHHLCMTLDDVVGDTLRPHHFCKPIAKRPADRECLLALATAGTPWAFIDRPLTNVFLGSDSAPHYRGRKECDHGCAGVFSAPVLVEKLVEIFSALPPGRPDIHPVQGALDRLPDFCCHNGRRWYGLPDADPSDVLKLRRDPYRVPDVVCDLGTSGKNRQVVPWCAGETLPWRLVGRGGRDV